MGMVDCSLTRLELHVSRALPVTYVVTTSWLDMFGYHFLSIPATTNVSISACTFAANTGG